MTTIYVELPIKSYNLSVLNIYEGIKNTNWTKTDKSNKKVKLFIPWIVKLILIPKKESKYIANINTTDVIADLISLFIILWEIQELNLWPLACHASALPDWANLPY